MSYTTTTYSARTPEQIRAAHAVLSAITTRWCDPYASAKFCVSGVGGIAFRPGSAPGLDHITIEMLEKQPSHSLAQHATSAIINITIDALADVGYKSWSDLLVLWCNEQEYSLTPTFTVIPPMPPADIVDSFVTKMRQLRGIQ